MRICLGGLAGRGGNAPCRRYSKVPGLDELLNWSIHDGVAMSDEYALHRQGTQLCDGLGSGGARTGAPAHIGRGPDLLISTPNARRKAPSPVVTGAGASQQIGGDQGP